MPVTIHVPLPEEAVECWAPAQARHLGDDRYLILDEAPDDPVWQFGKGDIVRCQLRKIGPQTTFTDKLVAFEISN